MTTPITSPHQLTAAQVLELERDSFDVYGTPLPWGYEVEAYNDLVRDGSLALWRDEVRPDLAEAGLL